MDDQPRRARLLFVRIGLPVAIAVVGLVLVIAGGGATRALGGALLGVALLVVIANLFIRLSIAGQRDRDREASARRRFMRTGHWPRT